MFINGGNSKLKKAHKLSNTGIRATVRYCRNSVTYPTKVTVSTKYTIGTQCQKLPLHSLFSLITKPQVGREKIKV